MIGIPSFTEWKIVRCYKQNSFLTSFWKKTYFDQQKSHYSFSMQPYKVVLLCLFKKKFQFSCNIFLPTLFWWRRIMHSLSSGLCRCYCCCCCCCCCYLYCCYCSRCYLYCCYLKYCFGCPFFCYCCCCYIAVVEDVVTSSVVDVVASSVVVVLLLLLFMLLQWRKGLCALERSHVCKTSSKSIHLFYCLQVSQLKQTYFFVR